MADGATEAAAPKKRKSKLKGKLAMWEQAASGGIDTASTLPKASPKKKGKRKSVKSNKSNLWENKIQAAKKQDEDKNKIAPISESDETSTNKDTTTSTTTDNNNDIANGSANESKDTDTSDASGTDTTDKSETTKPIVSKKPKAPKKVGGKIGKLAAGINLGALKPGAKPPPRSKSPTESKEPKEMSSEQFPRVTMQVDRHARTKKAKTDVLDFETKETETKDDENKDNTDDTTAKADDTNDDVAITTENKEDKEPEASNDNNDINETDQNKDEPPADKPDEPDANAATDTGDAGAADKPTEAPAAAPVDAPGQINTDNLEINTNDNISKLNKIMKEQFIMDEGMLMPSKYLLLYLKNVLKIDLSNINNSAISPGSEDASTAASVVWDNDKLTESITKLFGTDAVQPFGYKIRLLTENEIKQRNDKQNNDNNDDVGSDGTERGSNANDDDNDENLSSQKSESNQKQMFETL